MSPQETPGVSELVLITIWFEIAALVCTCFPHLWKWPAHWPSLKQNYSKRSMPGVVWNFVLAAVLIATIRLIYWYNSWEPTKIHSTHSSFSLYHCFHDCWNSSQFRLLFRTPWVVSIRYCLLSLLLFYFFEVTLTYCFFSSSFPTGRESTEHFCFRWEVRCWWSLRLNGPNHDFSHWILTLCFVKN